MLMMTWMMVEYTQCNDDIDERSDNNCRCFGFVVGFVWMSLLSKKLTIYFDTTEFVPQTRLHHPCTAQNNMVDCS